MKLRVVWWIPVAAVFIAHASGILGNVGTAITGVDNTLTAIIDLKKMFKQVVVQPIQPIVVPPTAKPKLKKAARKMPTKVAKQ